MDQKHTLGKTYVALDVLECSDLDSMHTTSLNLSINTLGVKSGIHSASEMVLVLKGINLKTAEGVF